MGHHWPGADWPENDDRDERTRDWGSSWSHSFSAGPGGACPASGRWYACGRSANPGSGGTVVAVSLVSLSLYRSIRSGKWPIRGVGSGSVG